MCMAYSGRCLLSNYLSYRESNKGACSQSCRWKYYLVEETRPGEFIPIEEDEKGTYIFNSKDLCALPLLAELIDAGVDSLKIEGRVKSAYYVAVTTSVYRRAIDLILNDRKTFRKELPHLLEELKKVSHRPYTTGFLSGNEENRQHYETSSYIRNYKFLAVFKNGRWNVRNPLKVGDEIEIFTPDAKTKKTFIKSIRIFRKNTFEGVEIAHPNQTVVLELEDEPEISENAILRRKEG